MTLRGSNGLESLVNRATHAVAQWDLTQSRQIAKLTRTLASSRLCVASLRATTVNQLPSRMIRQLSMSNVTSPSVRRA